MNYLTYPCKVMKLTQSHLMGNHTNHSFGKPWDYPIDECCGDTKRSAFFCPCDEMKVVRIYGVGASGINTVWLTSTDPVVMPCGTDHVTIMVEHPEDDDLKNLKVGQTFKRGEQIFREGGNGSNGKGTYGNHFHISVGTGRISGNGWVQNNKGAWVLAVTGKTITAEQAFFMDGTTIVNARDYTFQTIPKEEIKMDNTPDKYAAAAVAWAIQEQILKGDDQGNMKLHDHITRQDAVVLLYRTLLNR